MAQFCQKKLHHVRKSFSSSSSLSSSTQEGSLLSPLSSAFLCSGASVGIFAAATGNKFEHRWQGSRRESKRWTKTLRYCLRSLPAPCCLTAELFLVPAVNIAFRHKTTGAMEIFVSFEGCGNQDSILKIELQLNRNKLLWAHPEAYHNRNTEHVVIVRIVKAQLQPICLVVLMLRLQVTDTEYDLLSSQWVGWGGVLTNVTGITFICFDVAVQVTRRTG